MRIATILLLALLFAGCGRFINRGNTIGPNDLVICIRNDLAGYGNVSGTAAEARFDVMPGAIGCRRLIGRPASLTLTARTIGGGAAGPLTFAEAVPTTGPGCWLWRLGPAQTDTLLPMECSEVPSLRG